MSKKAKSKIAVKKWTKTELMDGSNWDFAFCTRLSPAACEEVWQYEAFREFGIGNKPFQASRKRMVAARRRREGMDPMVVSSARFLRVIDSDGTGKISNSDELVNASSQRVSPTRCLHLLEIDYQHSDRRIQEAFIAWLRQQRRTLKLPSSGRARPKGVTRDYREWLDDLAMYRFRKAKISAGHAQHDYAFKPAVKRIGSNPHDAFAKAHRATLERLQMICRDDPSLSDLVT